MYAYAPLPGLDSTRLLLIEPPTKGADAKYHLEIIPDLGDAPQYDALSYTWGDREPASFIPCDGGVLRITPNLANCLNRIQQKATSTVTIWIDAICINQEDLDERSQQVGMIQHIYRKAKSVFVWLGETGVEVTAAISLLTQAQWWYRVEKELEAENPQFEPYGEGVSEASNELRQLPPLDSGDWHALRAFFNRPWFSRVWVIQEIATASSDAKVMIGDIEAEWMVISEAATWLDAKGYGNWNDLERLKNASFMHSFNQPGSDHFPLLDLLICTSQFKATNLADKVFSLLGIANESVSTVGHHHLIRPDYTKTFEQVYRDAAAYLIQEYRSLEVLSQVHHDEPELNRNGSSWVPQWHRTPTAYTLSPQNDGSSTTRDDILNIYGLQFRGDSIFGLQGLKIDTVTECAEVMDFGTDTEFVEKGFDKDINKAYDSFSAWISDHEEGYFTGEIFLNAFLLVLTAGFQGDYTIPEFSARYWSDSYAYWSRNPETDMRNFIETHHSDKVGDESFYRGALIIACTGRCLFATKNLLIGLGPQYIQPGDQIVMLPGSKNCFVLRETELRYLFVGQCYAHGVKPVDLFRRYREGLVEIEVFDIN